MWEVLRSKNFLSLSLFMLVTSVSVWLLCMPTPNIRNIMTETHKQITNLKNINVMSMTLTKELELDESYMELLGFTPSPKLYDPNTKTDKHRLPVIVTGVNSNSYLNAFSLIASVGKYLPDHQVVIFDLGLGSYELVKLKKTCNESTSCIIRSFDFGKFPRHLRDMHVRAFKPVAAQEALNDYMAIIWTEGPQYFITNDVTPVLRQAEQTGIAAWTIKSREPTSALTHAKMFSYFKTNFNFYYFQHMVDADHLVLYNTQRVHKELMLRWVQCSLKQECIEPVGAQNVGCKTRKPRYAYSGCHRYETSGLNVILGLMFPQNESAYTSQHVIFGIEPDVEEGAENTTTKPQATKKLVDSA